MVLSESVDHPRADLDDEAAENGGVGAGLELMSCPTPLVSAAFEQRRQQFASQRAETTSAWTSPWAATNAR